MPAVLRNPSIPIAYCACALILAHSGCQNLFVEPPAVIEPPLVDRLELPPALADDNWVMTAGAVQDEHPAKARWRHPGLERLVSGPAEDQPDLVSALRSSNPVVVGNAAILLAYVNDGRAANYLPKAIRRSELKLPLRRAAAEALSRLDKTSAVPVLQSLLDEFGRLDEASSAGYVPELHAELLRALAHHKSPADEPRFADALESKAGLVRAEAITAWALSTHGELPQAASDLTNDQDPRVRAAALRAIVLRRWPQTHDVLDRALGDQNFEVRLAAVSALGTLGDEQSKTKLTKLANHSSELIRAAAIAALAEMKADDELQAAAADKSWRVRKGVAAGLAGVPSEASIALAHKLLADPSGEVQREVLAAVSAWPLEKAGPVLLAGMEERSYQTRKMAAEELSKRWPPAEKFPRDSDAQRRSESVVQLKTQWKKQFGLIDRQELGAAVESKSAKSEITPEQLRNIEQLVARLEDSPSSQRERQLAIADLVRMGPELLSGLEKLAIDSNRPLLETIYLDVLPQIDNLWTELARLAGSDQSQRRQAAAALEKLSDQGPLSLLALNRLNRIVLTDSDPVIWQSVLNALASDPREPAIRLVYTAMTHPASDVRRRACEHLGDHAQPGNVRILVPALADKDTAVVRAAVRALGHQRQWDDPQPLIQMLGSPDRSLRLEAAISLARLGHDSGMLALERLSHEPDERIRLQVTQVLGELGDSRAVPVLIRLLDDHQGVRSAALKSLAATASDRDDAPLDSTGITTSEQIARWKQWFNSRQGVRAATHLEAQTDTAGRTTNATRRPSR